MALSPHPDASPRSGTASIAGPKTNTYQADKARIDGTTEATDSAPLWLWVIVAGAVGLGAVGLLRTISRSKHD